MTRAGYHEWRNELKAFHATQSAAVLRAVGYGDEVVTRVQALNLKTLFPGDSESRTLEDALCLVFLQFQFAELARKTDAAKVINALQKSWRKMTPTARAQALRLEYGTLGQQLLQQALG